MNFVLKSFFQGLAVLVPVAVTLYIVYWSVTSVDDILGIPIPGVGFGVTIIAIVLIGALARNVAGRRALAMVDRQLERTPIVKLLYGSLRDLMGAFVGDKKKFDQPVRIELSPTLSLFGFVTCTHFDDPALADHVAVFLPQAYNFAGNLAIVPRSAVHPVDADGAQFMAFIVSGGVGSLSAAKTLLEKIR